MTILQLVRWIIRENLSLEEALEVVEAPESFDTALVSADLAPLPDRGEQKYCREFLANPMEGV